MFPDPDAGGIRVVPAGAESPFVPSGSRAAARTGFRTAEKILVAYFIYIAILSSVRGLAPTWIVLGWSIAAAVFALAWIAIRYTSSPSGILRDWTPLILILVGYWELQWFASGRVIHWQQTWLIWDRHVLNTWGLRAAIEVLGPVIPALLETAYLCLYAVPVFCLAILYALGRRDRVQHFLTTLLLGGFSAYALLPLFPSSSPRFAFPGADLPNFATFSRTLNLWLLNHFDISTSVFPSGHVAVAVSSAFGLWRALPEKRWLSYVLFALSTTVYIATIYARYHYAVDGLAGAGIAVLAWRTSDWMEHHV